MPRLRKKALLSVSRVFLHRKWYVIYGPEPGGSVQRTPCQQAQVPVLEEYDHQVDFGHPFYLHTHGAAAGTHRKCDNLLVERMVPFNDACDGKLYQPTSKSDN